MDSMVISLNLQSHKVSHENFTTFTKIVYDLEDWNGVLRKSSENSELPEASPFPSLEGTKHSFILFVK